VTIKYKKSNKIFPYILNMVYTLLYSKKYNIYFSRLLYWYLDFI